MTSFMQSQLITFTQDWVINKANLKDDRNN